MTGVANALAYLMARTMRNRIVSMVSRLKQPRYLIGFLFVGGYFGFLFFGAATGFGRGLSKQPGMLQGDTVRVVAPAILALILLSSWLGGSALSSLAFSRAEVAMLFPAPVTRRNLILYKLARAQVPILFNVVFFMVMWGLRPSEVPHILTAIGLYTLFTTMMLHRIGAALVMVSAMQHGRSAFKRNWLSYLIGAVVSVTMWLVIMNVGFDFGTKNRMGGALLQRVTEALSVPAVHAVLTPLSLIAGPALARTTTEWLVAFAGALPLLLLHLYWVLRSDTAFEEASAEQTERLQTMAKNIRTRGIFAARREAQPPKVGRWTIPLHPMGAPALALVWKNSLHFIRTFRPSQLALMLMAPAMGGALLAMQKLDVFAIVAFICWLFAVTLLLMGGVSVRNDLRGDLAHLSSLKTMPLNGRTIVLAEISSSALPLAMMQCALVWVGLVALQVSKKPMDAGIALTLAIVMPLTLAGLNLLASTIRNGVAVLFPAWTRLGSDDPTAGLEVMGQMFMGLGAMLIGVLVLMIVPVTATVIVTAYVKPPAVVALAFSAVFGAVVLFGECYLVMMWLGKVLERLEPSASLSPS